MPNARAQSSTGPRGKTLPLTVFTLCVVALIPLRFLEWLNPLSGLAMRVIAPISHPVSEVSRWVVPGRVDPLTDAPEQVLAEELERTRQAYLREKVENDRLRTVIEDLQRGFALGARSDVRPLTASVVGNPSDLSSGTLLVRAGSGAGVNAHTVATFQGTQLVGRVVRVLGAVSEVRPITARRAGRIDGAVMLAPDGSQMLACSLTPTDDQMLSGPVTEPDVADPAHPLAVGQDVRLRTTDGSWPDSAQMLLIGRIVEIQPAPGQSLRRWIVVKPLADLQAISQVVLRIPLEVAPESQP
ncbi:MAG: hypothetical protein DYG94_13080 [Leptolyngbya sp. PLA3]|nr:MAG: hypothetical protein EDM82_03255 [Cyanobacteria bacterium CYA]MCE7969659.1 hypothetical protein [Leptolyngbya sp. PL-A3]